MRINYNNTYLSKIKKQKDRYLHATQKWATQELPDNFTNNNRQFYREEYLKSDHWKNLRYCKLQQVCYCEMCDNTSTLDVHHINYKNLYDVELEDLMVLCRKCHVKVHDDVPNVSKWDKFNNVPELLTESSWVCYIQNISKQTDYKPHKTVIDIEKGNKKPITH